MLTQVDLAGLCVNTGAKNLPTVLLLTDAQIPDERFLIIISTLLSSGQTCLVFLTHINTHCNACLAPKIEACLLTAPWDIHSSHSNTHSHATGGLIVCLSDEWETHVNVAVEVK